jgi:hypothetical protein
MLFNLAVETGVLRASYDKGVLSMLLKPKLANDVNFMYRFLAHPSFKLSTLHMRDLPMATRLFGVERARHFRRLELRRTMDQYGYIRDAHLRLIANWQSRNGRSEKMNGQSDSAQMPDKYAASAHTKNFSHWIAQVDGKRRRLTSTISRIMMGALPRIGMNYSRVLDGAAPSAPALPLDASEEELPALPPSGEEFPALPMLEAPAGVEEEIVEEEEEVVEEEITVKRETDLVEGEITMQA